MTVLQPFTCIETEVVIEGFFQGKSSLPQPTEAEIAQANKLKEEGNAFMKSSQFEAAVAKYNEAIKLNTDPAYFCNRFVIKNGVLC